MEATEVLAEIILSEEVANAPLGDVRLSRRFVDVIESFGRQPGASVPKAMDNQARLEAYYRLMRNKTVDHFKLLKPHFDAAQRRTEVLGTALVVHDTSEIAFDIHDEPAQQAQRESPGFLLARVLGHLRRSVSRPVWAGGKPPVRPRLPA